MATLSAPSVWEPVYECASQVVVSGYVPGASIDIYAVPPGAAMVRIGGGVSFSATGQVFGVTTAPMVAGATVTATQTFSGATSPASPPVVVQHALAVGAPLLQGPLYECARCVLVSGMLPGAAGDVRDGGTTIGSTPAYGGSVQVGVTPALVAGHKLTARQEYCGNPGPDSPGVNVLGALKQKEFPLPPPEVQGPLYACQQYAVVDGCTPGAQAQLFVDGMPVAGACVPGTSTALWVMSGLVESTQITARQEFCGGSIRSQLSAPVVVRPAADIPRPALRQPLYEGDTSLVVAMTVAGEVVSIEAGGVQIGMGGAGGGDSALNVDPPLVAGQQVVATVELCGVKRESLPVIVRGRPVVIPAPKVVEPLFACAGQVTVAGCLPGARVRVFAGDGGSTVLLGTERTFSTTATVGVTPLLVAGWKVTATQEVGGVVSGPSDPVEVKKAPDPKPPRIPGPLYECARCLRVEQVIPGARVDVFQDGVWIGAAEAAGTSVEVGVYPGLRINTTISATQSLCGQTSKATKSKVSRRQDKLPAPKLSPAFAGDSFVTVENLVPGAIVEVEETSVYNLVVGHACATESTLSLWLNLPLFAGAVLRARQRLCDAGPYSPSITVGEPREWPLGPGPYAAGFRLVSDVPISSDVMWQEETIGAGGETYTFKQPPANSAVVFYPATAEGEGAPFAAGGPFPLIVYGHGRRFPEPAFPAAAVCPGAPEDITQDYRQLAGDLTQLARWGFVCIAPDCAWLAVDFDITNRQLLLRDTVDYMLAENGRNGSPFKGKIQATGIGAMGHSTGGLAAIYYATSGAHPIAALALIAPAAASMMDISRVSGFAPNPVLVLHGTRDSSSFGADGQPLSIYGAAAAVKVLVDIDGANHFGYTDALCLLDDNTATIAQADQRRIGEAYLAAFCRRFLTDAFEEDDYLRGIRPVEELEGFGITVQTQR